MPVHQLLAMPSGYTCISDFYDNFTGNANNYPLEGSAGEEGCSECGRIAGITSDKATSTLAMGVMRTGNSTRNASHPAQVAVPAAQVWTDATNRTGIPVPLQQ